MRGRSPGSMARGRSSHPTQPPGPVGSWLDCRRPYVTFDRPDCRCAPERRTISISVGRTSTRRPRGILEICCRLGNGDANAGADRDRPNLVRGFQECTKHHVIGGRLREWRLMPNPIFSISPALRSKLMQTVIALEDLYGPNPQTHDRVTNGIIKFNETIVHPDEFARHLPAGSTVTAVDTTVGHGQTTIEMGDPRTQQNAVRDFIRRRSSIWTTWRLSRPCPVRLIPG